MAKQLEITLKKSLIGRNPKQRATIQALGPEENWSNRNT